MKLESIKDLEALYLDENILKSLGRNIVGYLIGIHQQPKNQKKEHCMSVESSLYIGAQFENAVFINVSRLYKLNENKKYDPVVFESEEK